MTKSSCVDIDCAADVARARDLVRSAAVGLPPDLVSVAELVVSELVTNALLHAGGRAAVAVARQPAGLRIEVADANRRAPLVGLSSNDSMTGRGLGLVARLAARWGVEPRDEGKVVWADVAEATSGADERTAEELLAAWDDRPDDAATRVHVTLGEVPTDLLVAAKRHVDNLVREFTLAAAGDRSGTTAPVAQPLRELIDRVVHRFEEPRAAIKRQATAAALAGRAHTLLELDLPIDAADAAEEYVNALDEIDAYSRANRLLTLETPPQHRVFRRWYIGEIVAQLRAAAAGRLPPPVVPFERRLLAEVDAAEGARRAAERAARLASVAMALASVVTVEEAASVVIGEAVLALRATGGSMMLATADDQLSVPATVGYDEAIVAKLRSESRDAELPAATAMRSGEAIWLETIEERNQRFPALVGFEPETTAMCAVPVSVGGEVLGALRFSFSDRRLFDDDEQRFVLALAAEVGEALHRARLLESERDARLRLEHERSSLEKLAAIGEAMLRGGDLESIIVLATDAATQITGAQFGAFFYNAADTNGESYSLYTLSGIPRQTFNGESILRLDDVTADPRFGQPDFSLPEGHPAVRSHLAVPVTLSTGEVVGGLLFGHEEPGVFTADHERLVGGVAGQAAAAIENVRNLLEREHVAKTLQQSLLPGALPTIPGLDLGAVYQAASAQVGGDFYDVFPLPGDRWGMAIGDVCGRGPKAAAVTALTRYTIRTAALLGRSPGEVCDVLNEAMCSDDEPERFCSVIVLVLERSPTDPQVITVTYANGGHPPALVRRATGIQFAPMTGSLVGILPGLSFVEEQLTLGAGDVLVLYTDGVSEARRDSEEFGDHHLAAVVSEATGTAQDIAEGVTAGARAFSRDQAADDRAVFVLSVL